jgi:hypothetical protein
LFKDWGYKELWPGGKINKIHIVKYKIYDLYSLLFEKIDIFDVEILNVDK